MPTKKGAGGHPQNYDSRGRYCQSNHVAFEPIKLSRKEKTRKKEERRRRELYEKAKSSKDKYLFDVYLALETAFPGIVLGINTIKYDKNIDDNREFDIIAKKCIIEVKSGNVSGKEKQFLAQKRFAEEHNKFYYVFAPDINKMRTYQYTKDGINISRTINEFILKIKEIQK